MNGLKFFTLLRTLGTKEVDAFHAYLKFEYRNQAVALALIEYILRFSPGFRDEKRLEMGYAYRKVFKKEMDGKNDRKKVLNVLSDLHGWLQDYLICKKAMATSFENRALWLAVLHERGLEAEFSKQFSQLRAEMSASPKVDVTEYMKDMAVHHFMYYHTVHTKLDSDADMLRDYDGSLDLFYAVAKLKIACEKANRKMVLAMPLELSALVDQPGENKYSQHPLLLLYRETYQLLGLQQEESYDRLEALLQEYGDRVALDELHRILAYMYNYASSQIRNKKKEFWQKMHSLNKFGVKHAVFLQAEGMSVTRFNNIVGVACTVHDTSWASSFVASHIHFLPDHIRSDAELLATATILFEERRYQEVLTKLDGKKEFADLLDNVRARALVLKTHVDLGLEDDGDLLERCRIFQAFLHRHDKPKKREAIVATANFVKILQLLLRKKAEKSEIIREIEETKPLYFEDWLLEKASTYKKWP